MFGDPDGTVGDGLVFRDPGGTIGDGLVFRDPDGTVGGGLVFRDPDGTVRGVLVFGGLDGTKKRSECLLEYMEKTSLQICLGCWANFKIKRTFAVTFKHRNLFPSALHIASSRSFLSSFKA